MTCGDGDVDYDNGDEAPDEVIDNDDDDDHGDVHDDDVHNDDVDDVDVKINEDYEVDYSSVLMLMLMLMKIMFYISRR